MQILFWLILAGLAWWAVLLVRQSYREAEAQLQDALLRAARGELSRDGEIRPWGGVEVPAVFWSRRQGGPFRWGGNAHQRRILRRALARQAAFRVSAGLA